MDEIKRTTGPETKNGSQWEVLLSAIPPPQWLELFRMSGEASVTAVSRRVMFDRNTIFFKSDEQHVEHWIRSIDKWIASTNARYAANREQASRQRATRDDAETTEKERIRQLNERFKNL